MASSSSSSSSSSVNNNLKFPGFLFPPPGFYFHFPPNPTPPPSPIVKPPPPHPRPAPTPPAVKPPPHPRPAPPRPPVKPSPPYPYPTPPSPAVKPPPHPRPTPSPPDVKPPPPPPHPRPSPTPRPIVPPPHPLSPPPSPAPPPGHHSTVIVIVFVSLGGLFLLAFLALCCFIKKRKRRMDNKAEILNFDKHMKVQEAELPGPHGEKLKVVTIEEDIHFDEEIKKSESLMEASHMNPVHDHTQEIFEAGQSSGSASTHPNHHHQKL